MNRLAQKAMALLYGVRSWLLRQPLFTSTLLPAMPRSARWVLRKLYFLPIDLIERRGGRRDEMIPPKSKIFVGSVDDFRSSGDTQVHQLVDVAGLTPDSKVLDIGCGIGRLAIPLTSYLRPSGAYEGLDIVPSGIEWCNEKIASRYPNFRFTLADVFNKEYNPTGRVSAREYRFPYESETFDLVVLISVFTHMLPPDMEHYIAEIARVLKPGGRCFASYLLIDADSRQCMESGLSRTRFRHSCGSYSVVDPKVPELSVGYDEPYVRSVYKTYGLDPDGGIHRGSWRRRAEFRDHAPGLEQDVVVSTRMTSGGPLREATAFRNGSPA